MAKAKKIEVTEALVKESLPNPPEGFSYTVERITPMVIKVWLNHPDVFTYTTEQVRTVHSFIKRDMVHAPKNQDKMRVKAHCHISELSQQSPMTTIKPDPKALAEFMAEFNCSCLPIND